MNNKLIGVDPQAYPGNGRLKAIALTIIVILFLIAFFPFACFNLSNSQSKAYQNHTTDDESADDDTTEDDAAGDDVTDDDQQATDGFQWTLYGDMGDFVSGTAYISASKCESESNGFENSTLDFYSPDSLAPNTEYQFIFDVYNAGQITGEKQNWIKEVYVKMPSKNYSVDIESTIPPDPLHGNVGEGEYQIDNWEVYFDADKNAITWECFGVVTSFAYGDIREGETLAFLFFATTDTE